MFTPNWDAGAPSAKDEAAKRTETRDKHAILLSCFICTSVFVANVLRCRNKSVKQTTRKVNLLCQLSAMEIRGIA
ncbi:MAG: hypothetical protein KIG71_02235 [Eubacteriales bacterium]|nr:hypothetical protein [Eubacteriales bacterium]